MRLRHQTSDIRHQCTWLVVSALLALAAPMSEVWAELVMKVLVVNPSETEVKEFEVRNPLPPEIKPEHVIDADGLKVDYDSQAGAYVLSGTVTLKPKESLTKRVILEDVWVIAPERLTGLRRDLRDLLAKLAGTSYEDRGRLLGDLIERRLSEVEESQNEPFVHPTQHINRYRENVKTLDAVEADLASLRQLMVMASLPTTRAPEALSTGSARGSSSGMVGPGRLSILTTWWIIFGILGLLGFVSLSFFLVWRRQLKTQLAKQASQEAMLTPEAILKSGNGKSAGAAPDAPAHPRLNPKTPLSP